MSPLDMGWLARERMEDLRREAARSRLAYDGRRARITAATSQSLPVSQGLRTPASMPHSPRRRLLAEVLAVAVSVIGFGLFYGMNARAAGFSLLELEAMNLLVFAGGSQLLAVGMIGVGVPWAWIVAFTAVLNSRHLAYGATLAQWFGGRPLRQKLLAAHVIVDESFALATAHFHRLGRFDPGGYAIIAAMLISTWLGSTWLGWASATSVPPALHASLQGVAPAAMAGMAVLLITDGIALVAALVAATVSIATIVFAGPAVGIVVGAVSGSLVASAAVRARPASSPVGVDRPGVQPSEAVAPSFIRDATR